MQSFAISNTKKFTPAFDTDVNFFMPKIDFILNTN